MYEIVKAVRMIGIPMSWKVSKVILIHKKDSTTYPKHFRPINLLPIMYKIYSGIMAAKYTTISIRNNCISLSQKGFLPGIVGIQEHTFVLESSIHECKRQIIHFLARLLMLSGRFLMLLFSICSILCRYHIIYMLKEIYSNNSYEYQYFTVSPTAGVRQ